MKSRGGGSNLLPFLIIAVIAVIFVVGLLFFAMNLFSNGDVDTTNTPVAVIPDISPEPILTFDSESTTEEATEAPSLTPVDEPTTVSSDTPEPDDDPTEAPTDTDEPATETATDTDEPTTATDELPTETATPESTATDTPEPEDVDPFSDVYTELDAFGVPEEGIVIDTTNSFGDTYVVTTCSPLGPVATQNILGIMEALTPIADTLDEDVAGLAFAITDCNTDTVSISLGFDRETADSYWSGETDQSALQRAITRVR